MRIQYTGDIGGAPMPSTIELLRDHAADCRLKAQKIERQADDIIIKYGIMAESAVQSLFNKSGHWVEQARQAETAINVIERGVRAWNSSCRGKSQKSRG
jgi:hypothetical protein